CWLMRGDNRRNRFVYPLVRPLRGILVAAVLVVTSCVARFAGIPFLAQLLPGDRLHVSYRSRGCYHDQKYEIDFERATYVTAKSSGVTVTLSPEDVAGLDTLFQFYRSRPGGSCTTQDHIRVDQFRGDRKIATEYYTDYSCATYEMKGVTRLVEIAERLG